MRVKNEHLCSWKMLLEGKQLRSYTWEVKTHLMKVKRNLNNDLLLMKMTLFMKWSLAISLIEYSNLSKFCIKNDS